MNEKVLIVDNYSFHYNCLSSNLSGTEIFCVRWWIYITLISYTKEKWIALSKSKKNTRLKLNHSHAI